MTWRTLFYVPLMLLAALPASSNYQLGSYGFGTGGTAGTSSSNYKINGVAGDAAGDSSSSHYSAGFGANYQQQADAPLVSLSNPGAWYNKLQVTITPNGNPTDAQYAIAISPDNFATTLWVQPDLSIGSSFSISNFNTYTGWGGSSGVTIRGLTRSTVYTVKATAYRGKYTQGPFGPVSSGITTNDPSLSFEIDVSATDQSTSPPYAVSFGNLLVNTVNTPPVKVWVSLDTNADSGGLVYVSDQNGGLSSANVGYTVNSSTVDLGAQSEGYGVQQSTVTQASGGPLAFSSPFNVNANNIGGLTTTFQQILSTTAPVSSGRASFNLKAKSSINTPVAADYSDLLTLIAAAAF